MDEDLEEYDLNDQTQDWEKTYERRQFIRLPCDDCEYCTKREVRDKTLQLEDPKTGPSVRVQTRSQANQSTENPQTDSAVGMLPTDIDNIQRAHQ